MKLKKRLGREKLTVASRLALDPVTKMPQASGEEHPHWFAGQRSRGEQSFSSW